MMLSPDSRQIYLEALRPPPEYHLDCSIATTFSLDLLTLLMAPLSMALNQCRNREEFLNDPIAILEALRKTAGQFAVFCQHGRISIPKAHSLLYSYLENSVIEVQPPEDEGVFHPKIWLLRFCGSETDSPILYRLLCLSRNLTFDYSWDTILTLEGSLDKSRQRAFSRNHPLKDFINSLPKLAKRPLSKEVKKNIKTMTNEILRVRFKPPLLFDDSIRFIPIGIPGYPKKLKLDHYRKLLILSPFLTDNIITQLTNESEESHVISRLTSLNELEEETLNKTQEKIKYYFLDENAEQSDTALSEMDQYDNDISRNHFSGLHAKLFICEDGYDTHIYTGSANATSAAFTGKNIEFLVQLSGRRKDIGIDKFLGDKNEKISFRSMIKPYNRNDFDIEKDTVLQKLEKQLENFRTKILKLNLSIRIKEDVNKSYTMQLVSTSAQNDMPGDIQGKCFPITLQENRGCDLSLLFEKHTLHFPNMSIAGLTGFLAIELSIKKEQKEASLHFVLNLPVEGMPAERDKYILHEIIADRQRFIQYLLFILADDYTILGHSKNDQSMSGFQSKNEMANFLDTPLLEELLKAYSRYPERIERMNELINDLKETDRFNKLVPEGFEALWEVFKKADE